MLLRAGRHRRRPLTERSRCGSASRSTRASARARSAPQHRARPASRRASTARSPACAAEAAPDVGTVDVSFALQLHAGGLMKLALAVAAAASGCSRPAGQRRTGTRAATSCPPARRSRRSTRMRRTRARSRSTTESTASSPGAPRLRRRTDPRLGLRAGARFRGAGVRDDARKDDGTLAPLPIIRRSSARSPATRATRRSASCSRRRHRRYQGELLTSTTAIEEAERDGIVEPPVDQRRTLNQPIVGTDVRLDVGTGTPLAPGLMLYERHTVATSTSARSSSRRTSTVAVSPRYVLRRVGEEPLSRADARRRHGR